MDVETVANLETGLYPCSWVSQINEATTGRAQRAARWPLCPSTVRRLRGGALATTYQMALCLSPRPSTLTSVIIKGRLLLHVFQKSQPHARGHNLDRLIPSVSWFPIFCFPAGEDHNQTEW